MNEIRELFKYGTWANLALLDYCSELPSDAADVSTSGTFGPIRSTFVHVLEQEQWGLWVLGRKVPEVQESSWQSLRSAFVIHGDLWQEVFDNFRALSEARLPSEGQWESPIPEFPLMYALQTVHHQELHRTQIRAILGTHGYLPEEKDSTDVWAYWKHRGLLDLGDMPSG